MFDSRYGYVTYKDTTIISHHQINRVKTSLTHRMQKTYLLTSKNTYLIDYQ